MSTPIRARLVSTLFTAAAATALGVALTSCSSPRRGQKFEAPTPQPVITAQATYLDGAIIVDAQLGPFHRPRPPRPTDDAAGPAEVGSPPLASTEGDSTERTEHHSHGGGGMGGMGGPPPGGGMGGPPRGSGGGMRAAMAGGPSRQVLSVTLRNISDHPVHLRVADISSALGDFTPVPETFTLEPGASQDLEPMRGNYPAAISRLALTVRLRTVEANEEQVLQLVSPPAPAE